MRAFSFGGGVQSTAALVLAKQGKIHYDAFLFSNVGDDSENPETIQYMRETTLPYANKHGLNLVEVKRDGETIYQRLLQDEKHIGIPIRGENGAPGKRDCTVNYKIRVINKWLGSGDHIVGLGISLDEFQRMRTSSGFKHITNEYPLIDLKLTRQDCISIIESEGLPIPPKSSCWFCPFRKVKEWKDMRTDNPQMFQKCIDLENVLTDRSFRRSGKKAFLSSRKKPLGEAFPDSVQDTIEDVTCESGYCMV